MSNPKNEFENFFENPESAAKHTAPSPQQVVEALAVLTARNPEWYKNQEIRMVILNTLHTLGEHITELQEQGGQVAIHPACAAFLMTLGDFASATADQYGSDEEREKFHNDDDEESDEND